MICPNCKTTIKVDKHDPTTTEIICLFAKVNKTFKEYIDFMSSKHYSISTGLILKRLEEDFNIYSKEKLKLIEHIYYWFNGEKHTIKYGFVFNESIYYIHPFMLDIEKD